MWMPSRRQVLLSGIAAAALRPMGAKAQTEPVTILQLQRRTIGVAKRLPDHIG